jgi:hypothetical protein
LRSTNAIESMISICRSHRINDKRWRDGQMALRSCAAGRVEADKQCRRVNGHLNLAKVRAAFDVEITGTVGATLHDEESSQPDPQRAATEVLRTRDNLPDAIADLDGTGRPDESVSQDCPAR